MYLSIYMPRNTLAAFQLVVFEEGKKVAFVVYNGVFLATRALFGKALGAFRGGLEMHERPRWMSDLSALLGVVVLAAE